MSFKLPVSVLVVIYAEDTKRVLMLQRRDDPAFWQSVTGSLEAGETALQAAAREVKEEVAIDVACEQLTLIDCQRTVEFEIFSHLRHRYAPGVERNTEFWFCLALPHEREITFTEHLAYRWVSATEAAALTKSWSNRQAIEEFVINAAGKGALFGEFFMAGHSKWANTKHRKAAQDAKRGKIFTKIIRELVTAARLGGGDPASNPRLRAAVDKALSNNMTRDTLNRAIARGVGGDEDANMETIIYEGYGPGGTAVMVECLSDNRNRTVAEVRHAFTKTGGNLGTDGSVSYLFSKKGVISFEKGDEDTIMEAALEAGAEDVVTYDDGAIDVYTAWEEMGAVRDALEAAGLKADAAEVSMIPSTKADMDAETAPKLLRLIDMLEDCDDVQEVYHNGEISDEVAATL